MIEAAKGGMEEIELGRLAVERGSTNEVRQFGQRMVDEHTKANEELKGMYSEEQIELPKELTAKQKADVARFTRLSGAAFDRAYIKEAGVSDHIKAEKLFQNEATRGVDKDLKEFAARTLPTIREHLRMAREINSAMTTAAAKRK